MDSGCTFHFLLVTAPCLNKVVSRNPLTVRIPNGATMESSHTADLDIPELNDAASKAHVFPGMAHHSLLSVGQLCDEPESEALAMLTTIGLSMGLFSLIRNGMNGIDQGFGGNTPKSWRLPGTNGF
jgi:hypothetical protein